MKPMWNNRNLRLLVLGQASSLVGNYTLKFALSMYILEVTGSAALFATFLSVAMVPTIVLSPFGGILADRGDRRRILLTLAACAGLAVLLAALTPPPGTARGAIGACLLVLCGVLSEREALASIHQPTVFLFAGVLALPDAIKMTGAGDVAADWMITLLGNTPNP